jgi:hypothetical protein
MAPSCQLDFTAVEFSMMKLRCDEIFVPEELIGTTISPLTKEDKTTTTNNSGNHSLV